MYHNKSRPASINLKMHLWDFVVARNVRRIFVRGVSAPLLREAKKILKIWLRNGAFWSISVVSIAPFSPPHLHSEKCSFCMFSLFNFSSIFPGGSAGPICPYVRTPMTDRHADEATADATDRAVTGHLQSCTDHSIVFAMWRQCAPRPTRRSFGSTSLCRKRHRDRFSRFWGLTLMTNRQTAIQTDVIISRILYNA